MMRTSLCVILMFLLLASCEVDSEKTTNDRRQKGSYSITIDGSEGGPHKLIGENVDTNWDEELGIIFLNTDEHHEPLGTVTLNIGSISNGKASIYSAIVSKTDVRVGTGDQINGRTFTLSETGGSSTLDSITVGSNFISGRLDMKMERVLNYTSDAPESVTVKGYFTAL